MPHRPLNCIQQCRLETEMPTKTLPGNGRARPLPLCACALSISLVQGQVNKYVLHLVLSGTIFIWNVTEFGPGRV